MLISVLIVRLAATGLLGCDRLEKVAIKKMASIVVSTGISLFHSVLISNVRDCLNNLSFQSSDSVGAPIEIGLTMIPIWCNVSN